MPAYSNLDVLGADFLRLLNSPVGSDVRLIIGEEQAVMHAHSLVLQARSAYFARALSSDWKEANHGVIHKPNIKPAVFEKILEYIYGGRLMVDDKIVIDLIKAADELCMEDLLHGCEQHALSIVCRANVLDMVHLASQHHLKELKAECLDFIAANIDYLKRGKPILTLDADVLRDILSMDQLDLDELEIWKIAVRWTYYQQGLEWDHCPLVDFPKGSGCIIVQILSDDSPWSQYKDEDDCLDSADEAFGDARVPLHGKNIRIGREQSMGEDGFRSTSQSVFQTAPNHNILQLSAALHESLRNQIAPLLPAIRFMRIPSMDFLRLIEGTGLLPVQLCAKVYRYHSVPSMADPYQTSLRRRMAFSTILGKEHKDVVLEWLKTASQDNSTGNANNAWRRRSSGYTGQSNQGTLSAIRSSDPTPFTWSGGLSSTRLSSASSPTISPFAVNMPSSSPPLSRGIGLSSPTNHRTIPAGSQSPTSANSPPKSAQSTQNAAPQHKMILQYRATRDGFDAANFHMACDQRGPTLTVIRADNGMIFGGYNSSSWSSHPSGVYSASRSNFLFTLKSREHPHRENAIFGINGDGNTAAYNKADFGPTFGIGHDLYLATNCNLNCQSSSIMPSSYNGVGASTTTLAGSFYFRVQEYEVFMVQSSSSSSSSQR
ncbi:hypothetical protein BC939DRAFT_499879 [Gamsiella multidivaricata]|uniref:uncharacterized protein n=1 Tax=Gamsiella multidivaricata TaxID=101098 RepID=UPI00221FF843|nr:uncharacterized protein BC939DRAFT_499879 [Gamsiella multidivaricata]KAI7829753.1 hypothetical protein BC939DRAFT_499879 [Gamsiella multidivaricata]